MIVKLTGGDIENILDYRMAFESGMLRQTIGSISEEQIRELEEIDELCVGEEAVKDFWVHWEYNRKFHLKLMSFNHNEFAYHSLEQALTTLMRAYDQVYRNQWKEITYPQDAKYHKDIIEVIRSGGADKAATYLSADLKDFGKNRACEGEKLQGKACAQNRRV